MFRIYMRVFTLWSCFQFLVPNIYGQIQVDLFFKNDCNNSFSRLEYQLFNLNNNSDPVQSEGGIATVLTKGRYQVTSSYVWGDNMIGAFDHLIEINDSSKYSDTLSIPMIKFTSDGVLHSKYWNYFKCEKLCNGLELDFYPNGKKRLEGEFRNGKPNYIIEYRSDGTKEIEFWFVPGTVTYNRVNWFDERGKLDEYDEYKNRKRKVIKTTFTSQGKKVGREVIKRNWVEKK